jgi:REP element-mobilizing transposase RayT
MRRARITFKGAFHHVMNRGLDGKAIFESDCLKAAFIEMLYYQSQKYRLRLLAYSVMNNHYHLILQNSNNRMSPFQRDLNGQYGSFYRKVQGGKGYVFQGRFKSTLVQEEKYLILAIRYALQNPIRAKLVDSLHDYRWTSLVELEKQIKNQITDVDCISEIFGSKEALILGLEGNIEVELPITKCRCGDILGTKDFIKASYQKFDRRCNPHPTKMGRIDDGWFEPIEKVIREFEEEYSVDIDRLECHSWIEKRMRGDLLIRLKDQSGLTYREIKEIPVFNGVKMNSLAKSYCDARKRRFVSTK